MEFIYNDGGRSKYFKASNVGDCVARAIANASGLDYKFIYDRLNDLAKTMRKSKRERGTSNSRNGVHTRIAKKFIEEELGWVWCPTMTIGSGCHTHLCKDELPSDTILIVNLSKHFSCVKYGVLYDTYDCSRGENRCVYGYWRKPTDKEKAIFENTKKQEEELKELLQAKKEQVKKEQEERKAIEKRLKALYKAKEKKIKDKYAKKIKPLERALAKELKAIEVALQEAITSELNSKGLNR